VLGLDHGGNCRGVAYRVPARDRNATVAYLRAREQITMVYRETWRTVWLHDDPRQNIRALCFMVDRRHPQYAGRLTLTQQLHYVRQGHGRSGINRDYVLETVRELEALGFRDNDLHRLAAMIAGSD
jgi:cation transport protein ChaC